MIIEGITQNTQTARQMQILIGLMNLRLSIILHLVMNQDIVE